MSDPRYGAALVRAVIADPADYTARAVLADWLGDRCTPDEYIGGLIDRLRGQAIPDILLACPQVDGVVTVVMRWDYSYVVDRWSLAQWRAIPSQ